MFLDCVFQGVCCQDEEHCCPPSYSCDVQQHRCVKNIHSIPWVEKQPALPGRSLLSVGKTVCPGGAMTCEDHETCCPLATGGYGCCPFDQAVCCSDQVHCCPKGTTCNLSAGTCDSVTNSLRHSYTSLKYSAKPIDSMASQDAVAVGDSIICPDKKSRCGTGQTCCMLATGVWGCCPLPDAVCCEDKEHCCPQGSVCNMVQQTCDHSKDSLTQTWIPMEKRPAVAVQNEHPELMTVKCEDQTECRDGNTCCQQLDGSYACCQYSKAVCCDDHIHCCPNGYQCNKSQCVKGPHEHPLLSLVDYKTSDVIPWVAKIPALDDDEVTENSVKCSGTAQCPDNTTCCKDSTGEYRCCPLLEAVCCHDGEHCCPHGYTCNLPEGTCSPQSSSNSENSLPELTLV